MAKAGIYFFFRNRGKEQGTSIKEQVRSKNSNGSSPFLYNFMVNSVTFDIHYLHLIRYKNNFYP